MGVNVHVVTLWENFSRNYVRTSLSWVYTFATEESINVPDNDNLPDNLYVKVYLYHCWILNWEKSQVLIPLLYSKRNKHKRSIDCLHLSV